MMVRIVHDRSRWRPIATRLQPAKSAGRMANSHPNDEITTWTVLFVDEAMKAWFGYAAGRISIAGACVKPVQL
ncbi:hypothetical protein Mal65_00650 [Crateriforma conspicua]|nr:hypothetical protein Mal65_00650 [Crateriforma conspicua]